MTINSLHTQVKNNGASIHYFLDRYNNTVLGVLELGCRSLTLQLPQAAKVTSLIPGICTRSHSTKHTEKMCKAWCQPPQKYTVQEKYIMKQTRFSTRIILIIQDLLKKILNNIQALLTSFRFTQATSFKSVVKGKV